MKPHGVFLAIPTQFRRKQGLDLASTADQVDRLIGQGIQGIVLLSSMGEPSALSLDEKFRIVETVLNINHGRVPIYCTISEPGTGNAQAFIREAEEIGIDGLLLVPPPAGNSRPRSL